MLISGCVLNNQHLQCVLYMSGADSLLLQIKTMQATILTQNMLNDDDMKTESQVSIAKIKGETIHARVFNGG